MSRTPMIHPSPSAKNDKDEDRFTEFARRLMRVPHSEIKAKLDAEKAAKRTSKTSASRGPGVSPAHST
jgi:hypothetical protein